MNESTTVLGYDGPQVRMAVTGGGYAFHCDTCSAQGKVESCQRVADGAVDKHFWTCPEKPATELFWCWTEGCEVPADHTCEGGRGVQVWEFQS